MAKRFTSTEIWEEDWFLDMPNEYKLFWYYMLCNCDHSGLFKVNLRSFCGLLQVNIDPETALKLFNHQKDRIRIVNQSLWFIEDFFCYQYGPNFNINNPLHRGVLSLYNKYGIKLTSIRGLKEVNDTLKEKDKDMYLKNTNTKVKNSENGKSKNEQFTGNYKSQGEELLGNRIRNSARD